MTLSVFLFAAWAMVGMAFLALILQQHRINPIGDLRQIGDTSLGRHSVDWLGAIALATAFLLALLAD